MIGGVIKKRLFIIRFTGFEQEEGRVVGPENL
jgi:hypothetical protein